MNRLLPPRRLIPRWRQSRFAVQQLDTLGLVKSAGRQAVPVSDEQLVRSLAQWKTHGTLGHLADVLAFASVESLRPLLQQAANAALANDGATAAMKLAAREALSDGSSEKAIWRGDSQRHSVHRLRTLLRLSPNNPLALLDLAQFYLASGKVRAAERALLTARQLAPGSVNTVRALTRYWVHLDRPDRAHAVLRSSSRLTRDPWLMASEIAVAQVAAVASTQLKRAQRALFEQVYRPSDATELAGAVAGYELKSGNLKQARKLFRLALTAPNDNVMAQAVHNQQYLGIEIDEEVYSRLPAAPSEVLAYRAILSADFLAAADFVQAWGDEEPYSSRPKTLESYVHGSLGRYEESLRASDLGLQADPDDVSLQGNRAYALAALGRLTEAERQLRTLELRADSQLAPFACATRGMVALFRGRVADGLALYEAAVEAFRKRGDEESITTCRAFLARSAIEAEVETAPALLRIAEDRLARVPSPAAAVILQGLGRQVSLTAEQPASRISQWEYDPQSNQLTRLGRQVPKRAGPILIKSKTR